MAMPAASTWVRKGACLEGVHAFKGQPPRGQFPHDRAPGPHVGGQLARLPAQHLGRQPCTRVGGGRGGAPLTGLVHAPRGLWHGPNMHTRHAARMMRQAAIRSQADNAWLQQRIHGQGGPHRGLVMNRVEALALVSSARESVKSATLTCHCGIIGAQYKNRSQGDGWWRRSQAWPPSRPCCTASSGRLWPPQGTPHLRIHQQVGRFQVPVGDWLGPGVEVAAGRSRGGVGAVRRRAAEERPSPPRNCPPAWQRRQRRQQGHALPHSMPLAASSAMVSRRPQLRCLVIWGRGGGGGGWRAVGDTLLLNKAYQCQLQASCRERCARGRGADAPLKCTPAQCAPRPPWGWPGPRPAAGPRSGGCSIP